MAPCIYSLCLYKAGFRGNYCNWWEVTKTKIEITEQNCNWTSVPGLDLPDNTHPWERTHTLFSICWSCSYRQCFTWGRIKQKAAATAPALGFTMLFCWAYRSAQVEVNFFYYKKAPQKSCHTTIFCSASRKIPFKLNVRNRGNKPKCGASNGIFRH